MESAGRERGKEVRKRPAGVKWQENAKKILNRGNELNKSFRINKRRKKRTQNELNFEPKNARITPKKRVLGGTFHVTGGSSVDSRFPESVRLVAARPPHHMPACRICPDSSLQGVLATRRDHQIKAADLRNGGPRYRLRPTCCISLSLGCWFG